MKVINERTKIYGNFKEVTKISQKIKDMYYNNDLNKDDPIINEAFEMIAHKLSRIINNGTKYIDNWRDIAGYAQLVVDYLENYADEAMDSKVVYYKKEPGRDWQEIKNE